MQITQKLEASHTSLKDYINSRGFKYLAKTNQVLLGDIKPQKIPTKQNK